MNSFKGKIFLELANYIDSSDKTYLKNIYELCEKEIDFSNYSGIINRALPNIKLYQIIDTANVLTFPDYDKSNIAILASRVKNLMDQE